MVDKVATSKIMANAILSREERNWGFGLNGAKSVELIPAEDFVANGLIPVESINSYLAEGLFSINVSDLKGISNFYVCGKKINAQVSGPMAITISVDDIHQKTSILRRGEGNINVGIINPILLPQDHHSFKVRIDYLDEADQPIKLADKAVLITHLVVDDVVVKNIRLQT